MKRLDLNNIPANSADVSHFSYNKEQCEPGIVHFGVGNFHRAHQAIYCDDLLCAGEKKWAIIGVSLRSPKLRDALTAQDFLYTQVTLGPTAVYRIVGAIIDILVAPENPGKVIDAIANSRTQVVTTTITEKGYYLCSGKLDSSQAEIRNDKISLQHPHTIYGYLAAAIIKRCDKGGGAFTIICCDNIQNGGEHLRGGVFQLLAIHCSKSRSWAEQQVTFCSSMVDRVTPATDDKLKHAVSSHLQVIDAWPVASEPFTQWVIEDNFAGEKPPFDHVGALFVDDIEPFERMKLRFLNAGHSIASALGYLAGDQFIHQALERVQILTFLRTALLSNVLPAVKLADSNAGPVYIEHVISRFQNAALPYAVLQVGTDSSQKIQQRWLPTIDSALHSNLDTSYLQFSLAAWVAFVQEASKNNELSDPLQDEFLRASNESSASMVDTCLSLAGAEKFNLYRNVNFITTVTSHYQAIYDEGIERALEQFLSLTLRDVSQR